MTLSPKGTPSRLSTILRRILSTNLKRLRANRSQAEIAKLSGLDVRNYARLERLERGGNPKLDTLADLAKAFKVEPYELIQPFTPSEKPSENTPPKE